MLLLQDNALMRCIWLRKLPLLIYFISVMEKSREKEVPALDIHLLPEYLNYDIDTILCKVRLVAIII